MLRCQVGRSVALMAARGCVSPPLGHQHLQQRRKTGSSPTQTAHLARAGAILLKAFVVCTGHVVTIPSSSRKQTERVGQSSVDKRAL